MTDFPELRSANTAHLAIAVAFFAVGLFGLWLPETLAFDERYYVGAALNLASGDAVVNREHPMLAKEIVAVSIWAFGESLLCLRMVALAFGAAGLYLAARALWWHTRSDVASTTYAILLATGGLLFGLSRLVLLEPFLFLFTAAAVYFQARQRTLWAAAAIGLSIACKWTAVPVWLVLVSMHLWSRDWRLAFQFALVSASTYLATFIPGLFVTENPLRLLDLAHLHLAMHQRISLFVRPHPDASQWWEWLYGGGAIYLGPMAPPIAINPLTALPATIAVVSFRSKIASIFALASLALFPFSGKEVLLVHQFLLPHAFMLAALSVWLSQFQRWVVFCFATLSTLSFALICLAGPSWLRPESVRVIGVTDERQAALLQAVGCLERPRSCTY